MEEDIVYDVSDTFRSSSATYKQNKKGSSGRKDSEISFTDQVMLKWVRRVQKSFR